MMIKRALDNIGITSEVAGSAKSAAAEAAASRPSQKLPPSPLSSSSTALPPLRVRKCTYDHIWNACMRATTNKNGATIEECKVFHLVLVFSLNKMNWIFSSK